MTVENLQSILITNKKLTKYFFFFKGTDLKIVAWDEADLTMTAARLVPLRVGRRPVEDLESVAFLKRQFLVIGGGEGVQSDNNV